MVFFHNHLLYGDIAKIYRIHIKYNKMMNYFFRYNLFDTYYPFTMLNSHLFYKNEQFCRYMCLP